MFIERCEWTFVDVDKEEVAFSGALLVLLATSIDSIRVRVAMRRWFVIEN